MQAQDEEGDNLDRWIPSSSSSRALLAMKEPLHGVRVELVLGHGKLLL
jgi:hypothetical protein